jgi:hypothetical protein
MLAHPFRIAAALAATVACLSAGSSAAVPVAHLAKSCTFGSGRQFGYTYLTGLYESGTTCSVATSLAKAHGHQSGWKCTIKRVNASPIQYMDDETCTSGSRKVVWSYSQNVAST